MSKGARPKDSEADRLARFQAILERHGVSYNPEQLPVLHREFRELAELLLDLYLYRQFGGAGSEKWNREDKRP